MQVKILSYTIVCLGLAGMGVGLWSIGLLSDAPVEPPAAALPSIDNATEDLSLPFYTPDTLISTDTATAIEPDIGEAAVAQRSPLEQLNGLLASGRYAEAAELYGELYNQRSESESRQFRRAILAFADRLSTTNQHQEIVNLMRKYTHLFFKDLPALRLLSNSLHELKRYPKVVEVALLALNEAYLEQDIIEFRQRLENAIAAQDLAFIQRGDPNGAVEFHRSLTLKEPASVSFQIGLARALLNAGDFEGTLALLETLPENTEYAGQIDRLKQMAEATRPAQAIAIPLGRAGSSFVVEAAINGGAIVRLLVDTGATLTVIRPEALRSAGVGQRKYIGETTLETAGGRVNASLYSLDSLTLGPEVVRNVRIGSIRIPGLADIDGLLGMNVLNQFRFAIDQTRPVLLLTR